MGSRCSLARAVACAWLTLVFAPAVGAEAFDLVIANGRVMDPETGFDGLANVGIRNGEIVSVSSDPLSAPQVLDAEGMVVAPGFIDLHAHGQLLRAQDLQVRDGVTTALEQEIGVFPVEDFYAARRGKSRINFGATVGHQSIRIRVTTGETLVHPSTNLDKAGELLVQKSTWAEAPLDPLQLEEALTLFEQGVAAGGLGLGLAHEYVPGASRREIYAFTERAADLGVPVFVHVRAAHHPDDGGLFEMVQEMLANAAATGASLHICHVTSKGLGDTELILGAIEGARANGLDVTAEAYPYTAGSTMLGSALFNEGWQQRWGVGYESIEWPATGERLTSETFYRYRAEQPATHVIFHMIPESAMIAAISHPDVMIASDGGTFASGHGHPRGAGSYARVLGVFVRERGDLPLMLALAKMSLMPAQRLQDYVPSMRRKGRIQEGMDADITVFDPETVIDRATWREPMQPSAGIAHVLVAGVPVVLDGVLQTNRFPGESILAAPTID